MRRVPGNHRLGGGDAEKGGESKKNDARGGKGRRKEKRSLEKMEEDHCTEGAVMGLGVKPWEPVGPWVIMLMMMMVMLRSMMQMIVMLMEGVP